MSADEDYHSDFEGYEDDFEPEARDPDQHYSEDFEARFTARRHLQRCQSVLWAIALTAF